MKQNVMRHRTLGQIGHTQIFLKLYNSNLPLARKRRASFLAIIGSGTKPPLTEIRREIILACTATTSRGRGD